MISTTIISITPVESIVSKHGSSVSVMKAREDASVVVEGSASARVSMLIPVETSTTPKTPEQSNRKHNSSQKNGIGAAR